MGQIKAWGWGLTRVRLFGELEASGFVVRRTHEAKTMLLPSSNVYTGTSYSGWGQYKPHVSTWIPRINWSHSWLFELTRRHSWDQYQLVNSGFELTLGVRILPPSLMGYRYRYKLYSNFLLSTLLIIYYYYGRAHLKPVEFSFLSMI